MNRQPTDFPRRRPGWIIDSNTMYIVHALLEDAGLSVTMYLTTLTNVQMPCHDDATWV